MWRGLAVVVLGVALVAAAVATGVGAPTVERRVALIIGNSAYVNVAPLKNTINDARTIEAALKKVGFQETFLYTNLNKLGLEQALLKFGAAAATADVAVVYYAGHGVEVAGNNYLIPVEARLTNAADVDLEAVRAETAITVAQRARRISIVVLDACRNNPFVPRMKAAGGQRAIGDRGLAAIEPGGETLVAFAAKAGSTAADGEGGNSPYAKAFAARIVEPGVEVGLVFRRVRDDVLAATRNGQEPFVYGSLGQREFYFVPGHRETGPKVVTTADWVDRIRGLTPSTPRARYVEAFGQPQESSREASLGGRANVDWDRYKAGPYDIFVASAGGKSVGMGIIESADAEVRKVTPIPFMKIAYETLSEATLGNVASVGICQGKADLSGEAGVVYLVTPPCGLGTTTNFANYSFVYAFGDDVFDDKACERERVQLSKTFASPKCRALRDAKPAAAFVDWGLNAQAGARHMWWRLRPR